MRTRKTPLRKCVSCDERKEKKELFRIVKNKEQEVFVDISAKADGRGAYICRKSSCFEKAKKNKRLNRALRIDIPDEVFDRLIEEIKSHE